RLRQHLEMRHHDARIQLPFHIRLLYDDLHDAIDK
ncbi:unnamed protein product, partial [Rotaria magnacalcarata]